MTHTLKVYHYKMGSDEGIVTHWAELGHALIRLKFAVVEFERGMNNLKDLDSILRVHYQLQNYHTSAYEFAERLFSFVAALIGNEGKTTKRMLKDPNQQETVLALLSKKANIPILPLKRVMNVLHDDTELRHTNTHKTFIRLAFNNGLRWVDIEDLWDDEEDATTLQKAFEAVGKQGMRLAKQYKSRTERIDKNLNAFLKALLPYWAKLIV